ncbi:NUDIX hydrolase [Luteipulveratus mongoliensis]|uniref:Nudix hydrolase domain-containing protein n=1 Tax=Luteipulveratus mongoliensis TaxID=571913 RepID=A0A0K1JF65_9MICO|nr:NUDIX domain-containing protein [Luteipulveratus mongoliensis]AKU15346.1 hypothetical protein VV02_04820 [Luteipulveratus mongoliensis]
MSPAPGKVRVAAYGVCIRDGRILLVHQVSRGPAQHKWTLPGGGLDFGESPADGVRREVREETGCDAVVGAVIGVDDNVYMTPDGTERHGIGLLFEAAVDTEPVAPNDGEIDQVGWFDLNDLPEEITSGVVMAAELSRAALADRPD